ncbi:hypothetical protein [Eubacterium callanderi]|uniref:hypothetical protein n=1 Tax=Eubacterium callanderi TaxID=53442 RepID=UPI0029FECB05|nr:hypothetical protein [Eubacterium callanderi]
MAASSKELNTFVFVLKAGDQKLYFTQVIWEATSPDYFALTQGTLNGIVILKFLKDEVRCEKPLLFSALEKGIYDKRCTIVKRVSYYEEFQNYLKKCVGGAQEALK